VHSQLIEIIDEKKKEVALLKKRGLPSENPVDGLTIRDFKKALSSTGKVDLITEIKFASPSAGVIREKSDPISIGRMYESSGASAISLLTDEKFFGGSLENLIPLKHAVSIPILRKDFIIDDIQVKESLLFGADAILLIVRILTKQLLKDLLQMAVESGLAVLTEIHGPHELETALDCGAEIIGINNRDLDTFNVDILSTLDIAPNIPDGHIVVSESGIATEDDIAKIKVCGVDAVLVGTSIMGSETPEETLKRLIAAGKG
jgi:indole-3-glycerol phosphate synthase